jgi:hypothetical protein
MAKRTTIESDKQPSGKEIRTPDTQTIKNFNSTFDDVKATVDEANKDLQDSAKNAKSKHLNISAFKVVKGLVDAFKNAKNPSIASEKLAAWLANFDKLREHFKLDEHANLQGRFLKAGTIGDDGKPPRGTDEDGEPDMRPDHLRQPGASAASAEPGAQRPNPVADLAARAGAQTQPIDNVGRGPEHKPKPH